VTVVQLLANLVCQGFRITRAGDGVRVAPAARLTDEVRQAVRAHKPALLALLSSPRGPAPAFVWDQAEADRLMAELRDGLVRLEHAWPRGKFPQVKASILQAGVAVCEGYVRDRDLEAVRGWDALALLRGAVPCVLGLALPP
jgi:hypothetical protein